ncbi:MAG TPA: tetratricopeptide repeat protein, partial [Solirubrobacteraceae bacterium]|nr:tetratricopeptide repeat protein [Solirubrobacteraceae bacterium]
MAERDLEAGDRLAASGDLDGAAEAYRAGAEAGNAHASTKLGLLLEHRGRRGEALEAYARADAAGDGLGAFRHGMLLSAAGDWAAAQEAWARADERGREPVGLDLESALEPSTSASPRVVGAVSGLANPVMVGAIALLALVIAVFLSYISNAGLPFVPTRELKVVVGDGSNLVMGNDVREGGFRVGMVSDLRPVRLSSGVVGAQLTLKLDQAHGQVPV